MKIPGDREVFNRPLAIFWIDDDGILNLIAKSTPRHYENVKEHNEFLLSMLGGKKVYSLADVTAASPINDAARNYLRDQLPHIYKAMAMVSRSSVGKMSGTLVSVITSSTVPTKIF